jgi:hypothetical protein
MWWHDDAEAIEWLVGREHPHAVGAVESDLIAARRPIQPRISRYNRHAVALSCLPIGFD